MKQLIGFLMIVLAAVSCRYKEGSGHLVTEQRQVSSFTGVSVSGDFDVEIINNGTPGVSITADDNIIKDIQTRVRNGILIIEMRKGMNPRNAEMTARVYANGLEELKASASARINITDEWRSSGPVSLSGSSAGSIKGNIHSPSTTLEASSGASLDLSGQTRQLEVQVSSGGSVQAGDLLSEQTTAGASSGGSATVHASVKLDANASSGGAIHYRGNPSVTSNKSSGGDISKD